MSSAVLWAVAETVPAGTNVDPLTEYGPEWGKAAPIGLLVIVLMGVAVFLLIRSMNRQLRKVPDSFDPASSSSGATSASVASAATGASAATVASTTETDSSSASDGSSWSGSGDGGSYS
jgi:cytoskeletal protein RodZ